MQLQMQVRMRMQLQMHMQMQMQIHMQIQMQIQMQMRMQMHSKCKKDKKMHMQQKIKKNIKKERETLNRATTSHRQTKPRRARKTNQTVEQPRRFPGANSPIQNLEFSVAPRLRVEQPVQSDESHPS